MLIQKQFIFSDKLRASFRKTRSDLTNLSFYSSLALSFQLLARKRSAMKIWRLTGFLYWLLLWISIAIAQENEPATVGVQLFERGQLPEARQFFERFVADRSDDSSSVFYLGRIEFEEQRFDRAVEWFQQAVQREPANSDYHLWLGRAYGHQAIHSNVLLQPFLARKVKVHFEQAVELNPDNLAARADLQEYYEKAPGFLGGSTEKARQQAEEIAKRQQQQVQR
jgi:tetratricopeptide (TPR) repeat protein